MYKSMHFERRNTHACKVGNLWIGSIHPYIVQSMTNTPTYEIELTVAQVVRLLNAGADMVRITTQNKQEVECFREIKEQVRKRGYQNPLVSDVHFLPEVAEMVAQYADKVRINPGNYFHKNASMNDFSDFKQLLETCKKHNTALRIGVNHGSLNTKIVEQYGNTIEGMVESAMIFLEICQKEQFNNVVVSMKSSNTRTMIYANRLLAKEMTLRKMTYPIHLGVTEAGNGEDGRIKSAVGIGTLLAEGIGDTLRVSLTEAPENEIETAHAIIHAIHRLSSPEIRPEPCENAIYNPYNYTPTQTNPVNNVGGNNPYAVVANFTKKPYITQDDFVEIGYTEEKNRWKPSSNSPDVIFVGSKSLDIPTDGLHIISEESEHVLFINNSSLSQDFLLWLSKHPEYILVYKPHLTHPPLELNYVFRLFQHWKISNPTIVRFSFSEQNFQKLQIMLAVYAGGMLIDGFGSGIMISPPIDCFLKYEQKLIKISPFHVSETLFTLLQAARVRMTKTEFIACPSCGRTQFDIEQVLCKVKNATKHLKNLKIGVMGCIVNGPGEMADADYGYIGSGKGKVSLYKGKECVERNIDEKIAVERLVELIKKNEDWEEVPK